MLKLLPRLVTSLPQVAASLKPSGRTESTMGETVEIERPDRWTRRATIESSFSWDRQMFVSSQPFELNLRCHTLMDLDGPSHEMSSISGSRINGSRREYPSISRARKCAAAFSSSALSFFELGPPLLSSANK